MPKLSDYRMTASGPVLKRRAATKSRALRRPTDPGSARNRSRRRVADKRATRQRVLGRIRGPAKQRAMLPDALKAGLKPMAASTRKPSAGRPTARRATAGTPRPTRRPAARRRAASPRTRRRY